MKLRVINYSETGIYTNLALENVHLKNTAETRSSLLKFWKNESSVILGRTQEVETEVNQEYCNANGILIARRDSAGGAVYQDLGNLNVTTIFPIRKIATNISDAITLIIKLTISVLDGLNYPGCKRLRNSGITHEGLKVSGSAQYHHKGWLLHHFTLLRSVDLRHLENSLKARNLSPKSRNASKYYPTKNLENLEEPLFYKVFTDKFKELLKCSPVYSKVSSSEISIARELKRKLYSRDDWIFKKQRNQ